MLRFRKPAAAATAIGLVATLSSTPVGHEQQGAPQVRFLDPPSIALITVN